MTLSELYDTLGCTSYPYTYIYMQNLSEFVKSDRHEIRERRKRKKKINETFSDK